MLGVASETKGCELPLLPSLPSLCISQRSPCHSNLFPKKERSLFFPFVFRCSRHHSTSSEISLFLDLIPHPSFLTSERAPLLRDPQDLILLSVRHRRQTGHQHHLIPRTKRRDSAEAKEVDVLRRHKLSGSKATKSRFVSLLSLNPFHVLVSS